MEKIIFTVMFIVVSANALSTECMIAKGQYEYWKNLFLSSAHTCNELGCEQWEINNVYFNGKQTYQAALNMVSSCKLEDDKDSKENLKALLKTVKSWNR